MESRDDKLQAIFSALMLLVIISITISSCSQEKNANPEEPVFMNGADISVLPLLEDNGVLFSDEQGEADLFTILERHGFNSIRLKLWHTPTEPYNDLAHVKAMAQRIKAHDMHFMLDFHYSDWWADPQKQYKPAAWEELSFNLLRDSLYTYSKDVLHTLSAQGTQPGIVQIGNEIRPGLLWPDGRIDGEYDTPDQWDNLAALLTSARRGVLEGAADPSKTEIMIHFDNGGNNAICRKFFDSLAVRNVEYDLIGLSYYPKWHGPLDSLEANLADLNRRYGKPVMIVESAYPWTMEWADDQGNLWWTPDLAPGYEATVEGQVAYFENLRRIITNAPGGSGLYYWEPAWIAVEGLGTPWENATLFDFEGKALPALDAFTGHSTGEEE